MKKKTEIVVEGEWDYDDLADYLIKLVEDGHASTGIAADNKDMLLDDLKEFVRMRTVTVSLSDKHTALLVGVAIAACKGLEFLLA